MATRAKTKSERASDRKSRQRERPGSPTTSVDALSLLEQDHREVEDMFDEYDEIDDERRKLPLVKKLCQALRVHAAIEEEIFYPEARKATKDDDLLDEALVEHASATRLIEEIEDMEPGDELYDAKVRVLGELVKRHIREEEEELFPEVESAGMDLDTAGKKLAARKEELMSEMAGARD
jgi:hemerythrin-like domain-containing protein